MLSRRDDGQKGPRSPQFRRWLAGIVGAVFLATLTAVASGLGTKLVDGLVGSDSSLVSYSVQEETYECGLITYLPGEHASQALRVGVPGDWGAFQRQEGAAFGGLNVVQVAIQGESARRITLTGIRFSVDRRPRPDGATFSTPCGGPVVGRGVAVDLEADPPRIVGSSSEEDKTLPFSEAGSAKPLEFPWSVSLTDPLLLYVAATGSTCLCVWRAEIPWVSGNERGVIRIDNDGRGYRVAGTEGLPSYTADQEGWRRYAS